MWLAGQLCTNCFIMYAHLMMFKPHHGLENSACTRSDAAGMSLAGLLVVLTSGLDLRTTLGGKSHYLLFALATSLAPRMLMTLDEGGKLLPVPCRVGTAVDVVAQPRRHCSRCGGAGGQAKGHHRLPNTRHAGEWDEAVVV